MKITLDLKSLLIGAVLAGSALFAMGAKMQMNEVNRYHITGGASYFIVIDTATGQLWAANLAMPGSGPLGVQPGFWDAKDGSKP